MDDLNPKVSMAVLVTLPLNTVGEVRAALSAVPGVTIVIAKVSPQGGLWISTRKEDAD